MKGFDWRALADEDAGRAGFRDVRCPLFGRAFSLGGEVSPSVQVSFRRITFEQVGPQADLGIGRYSAVQQLKDAIIGSKGGTLVRDVGKYHAGDKVILETGLANVIISYAPE